MKKIISKFVATSIVASTILFATNSAHAETDKEVLKNEHGEVHNIIGNFGKLSGETAEERVMDALNKLKDDLGIKDVTKDFSIIETLPSVTLGKLDNKIHTRVAYQIHDIPVYGVQLIIHETDGNLTGVSGKYKSLEANTATSTINKSDAERRAVEFTGHTGKFSAPVTSTLVYLPKDDEAILSYKVTVCYLNSKRPGDWEIFVDATTGSILSSHNQAKTILGTGTGLASDSKKIQTIKKGNKYYLEDRSKYMQLNGGAIRTYNYRNGSLSLTYATDSDNVWNSEEQKALVDAHYNAGKVYDFYYKVLNRNSYDDQGASIISGVHYSTNYNNAFWSGTMQQMVYGDGDGVEMSSLSGALDVVAHELTHAVTQATSDLIYQDESGALNESWSDALASAIDDDDWMLGEEIWTPGKSGDALRYMDNPELGGQPSHMDDYINTEDDNGGVHWNSGIPNKAFYSFATAIGSRTDAAKVWYLASCNYMPADTDFSGARAATLLACSDLFGNNSNQYNTLEQAWTDVGV